MKWATVGENVSLGNGRWLSVVALFLVYSCCNRELVVSGSESHQPHDAGVGERAQGGQAAAGRRRARRQRSVAAQTGQLCGEQDTGPVRGPTHGQESGRGLAPSTHLISSQ